MSKNSEFEEQRMKGTVARVIFLLICLADAVLLLTHNVSTVAGCVMFAVSLAVLGAASHGFRRK